MDELQECISVEVAALNGEAIIFEKPATSTVLHLKRDLATRWAAPSAQLRLLHGARVLDNETVLGSLASGGTLSLQFLQGLVRGIPDKVEFTHGEIKFVSDCNAIVDDMLSALWGAGVAQGQVLWIDMHNTCYEDGAEISVVWSKDLPSRGVLSVACSWHQARSWSDFQIEDAICGKDVISITGLSQGPGCLRLAVFYYEGECSPLDSISCIQCEGGTWDGAALKLAFELDGLALKRGHLVGIDARNDGPDEPAVFAAYYSRSLPGHGPLCLNWGSVNRAHAGNWHNFHRCGCEMAMGRDVISVTSSSNCEGRCVTYTWYNSPEGVQQYIAVENRAGSWSEAARELLEKLREADVETGQLLQIDAHNAGPGTPAVLCARFDRERVGHGPLRLDWEIWEGRQWGTLYRSAAEAAAGRDVVAITGSSDAAGLALLLFHTPEAAGPTADGQQERLEAFDFPASSWNGAADGLLRQLAEREIQRGQLVSIDAHNDGPDEPAVFSAHVRRGGPGSGPLRIGYQCLNLGGYTWEQLHRRAAIMAAGREVLFTTGSSNCYGRRVLYVFYALGS